jgi:hypothetical protein
MVYPQMSLEQQADESGTPPASGALNQERDSGLSTQNTEHYLLIERIYLNLISGRRQMEADTDAVPPDIGSE